MKIRMVYQCQLCQHRLIENEVNDHLDSEVFQGWVAQHAKTSVHKCAEGQYGMYQFLGATFE